MEQFAASFSALWRLVLFSFIGWAFALSASSQSSLPNVTTRLGPVEGFVRHGAHEYRGIPYALAPTGDRRWALPESVSTPWNIPFKAHHFGPACPQQARFNLTEASTDEDCLSLNVSVPADIQDGEKLPVLFWIHGGAFIGGSSSLYRLDKLAREGRMVVVSANYRLGALGFMPHAAFASNNYNGNYGLEDQRLAMKWVQQNVSAFGGDPNNVTIAGESAGAGSVCIHLASPNQVQGLFQKAIIQSAGCMQLLPTVTEAQASGKASANIQQALCPSARHPSSEEVLTCMRAASVEQILKQQGKYTEQQKSDITPFSPVTGDPSVRPALVNATVPSSFKYAADNSGLVSVPMMIGGTKDELSLYVGYYWQAGSPPINASTIKSWLENFYPSTPAGDSQIYSATITSYSVYANLHSNDPKLVAQAFGQVLSDYNPNIGINNCLYLQTSNVLLDYAARKPPTSMPIYQFEFADAAAPVCKVGIAEPCPPFKMGAVHSSELNYLFPNLSNTAAINAPDLAPASQILADQMIAYWTSFASKGNPNAAGLPTWPLYAGANTASVMRLEPGKLGAVNSDALHQCTAFWKPLYHLP